MESGARGAIEPRGRNEMSDEKTDTRDDDADVEAHKFVTEEPGEDDSGKTKTKFKTKTRASEETGGDELDDRSKY
jgi:hypothetical protein